MLLKKSIDKLNYRLLVIHFLATLFLIAAVRQLICCLMPETTHLINYMAGVSYSDQMIKNDLKGYEGMTIGEVITRFFSYQYYGSLVTLAVSFFISFVISARHKISLINSLIVLFAGLLALLVRLFRTKFIATIFYSFGYLFESIGETAFYLSNALLLMIVGLTLFFNKRINAFIQKRDNNQTGK